MGELLNYNSVNMTYRLLTISDSAANSQPAQPPKRYPAPLTTENSPHKDDHSLRAE